jgi:hypothetical protein
MKHYKYHLIKIKHKDNTSLTKLDKNRINRDYLIAEVEFNQPCIVLCQDDDYSGFFTSITKAVSRSPPLVLFEPTYIGSWLFSFVVISPS